MRVKKDIAEFRARPPYGVFIFPQEDNLTKIHALVVGPSDTPYDGGLFYFFLKCPSTYPVEPPKVRIMTTDAGRVEFNPNLYASGKVCLSILGTWIGPPWTPAQTIESVLVSIQSLLNENPYTNEPGAAFFSPISKILGYESNYNSFLQHETMRVAVCDTVEACLNATSPCPPVLREQVLKTFSESYEKYEKMVTERLNLTGTPLRDRFFNIKGVYQYKTLLARLKDLNDRVKKRNEAATQTENE
ncbi:ubiquitin-conjugating enzyme E2 Z [Dermacentor silvarum]|uniref:ubiquitin-conjugating enzyme E2 Z n=1 Tax=Dermacentor silvarum TaxID=543639 RepID=UPI002101354E|nr:ubiquitin-conjugating enzyme E2 Z [Dermacentor silvarum]